MPNRVRELRFNMGRDGWSQERLGREARVSVYTISRIETGKRKPTPPQARRITRVLLGSNAKVTDVFPDFVLEAAV